MKTVREPLFLVALLSASLVRADDWPQWLGPDRDSVWRETGVVEKFPSKGPPVVWRAVIGGGYAGPAVAQGFVYLTDRRLSAGVTNPSDPFQRGVIRGTERVVCLNAADGKEVWQYEYECPYTMSYPAGPRVTPLVSGGKVYTLGAEGNLLCLEASSGKVIWSRDFKKDFGVTTPMWGFAGHPLL